MILAGGPQLAAVGALAGLTIPAGGVRHHVAVTEEHPAFADTPMVFDVPSGLYWRPEEGGLLFGMSDPDEPPGENRLIDFDYLALMRSKLAAVVPLTGGLGIRRAWAATIDFTPDHLPIIGPAPGYESVFVASAGGAGMMWGPAVGRAVADVSLTGTTDVVDTDRPWPRPVRRERPEQARRRPDRAALPGNTGIPGTLQHEKLAFPERAS